MLNIRGLTIEVSQGDALSVSFNFDYILQEGDIVTLAILGRPLLTFSQERPGESSVVFEFPTDLPVGEYFYDISIKFANETIQTLNWLRTGNFIIRRIARQ